MIPRSLPIPEEARWRPGPGGLEQADFRDSNGVGWCGVRRAGQTEPDRLFTSAEGESLAEARSVPVALSSSGFSRLCRTWRAGRAKRGVDAELLTDSVRAVSIELLRRWDYDSAVVLNSLLYDDAGTGEVTTDAMVAARLHDHVRSGHDYLTPLNAAGVATRFGAVRDLVIGAYQIADRNKHTRKPGLPQLSGELPRNTWLRQMTPAQLVGLSPDEAVDVAALRQAFSRVLVTESSESRQRAVAMFYAPLLSSGEETERLPVRANYPAYDEIAASVGLPANTVSLVLRDAAARLGRNYRALRPRPSSGR